MFSRRSFVKAVLAGLSGVSLFRDLKPKPKSVWTKKETKGIWIGGVCKDGKIYMTNPVTDEVELVAHLTEWKLDRNSK